MKKLVVGVGVNDVDYVVQKKEEVEGFTKSVRNRQRVVWRCPYYQKWYNMLRRSYSQVYHKVHPTYIDCSVSEEFKKLSDFIKWVDAQPDRGWEGKHLDKDLLFESNKVYSPQTCVFLSEDTNKFLNDNSASRGKYMLGVKISANKKNPYRAKCNDPLKRYKPDIGYFPTEIQAHLAWKLCKYKYALDVAEYEDDPRVKEALICRFK